MGQMNALNFGVAWWNNIMLEPSLYRQGHTVLDVSCRVGRSTLSLAQYLPLPPLSEWGRYCDTRCLAVCVSAVLRALCNLLNV